MQSTELVIGRSASLPVGYLQVRITGARDAVRLTAVDSGGADCVEQREGDGDIRIRPATRTVRLVAAPLAGRDFMPGTRVGIEVRTATMSDSPQVLVSELDAGAYVDIELAQVEFDELGGWRVTATGGRPLDRFSFLGSAAEDTAQLDERHAPWLGPGRYALRRALDGAPGSKPSGKPWAFVLDGSASMRSLFNPKALAEVAELVAGVAAESTGLVPKMQGTTGLLCPLWSRTATDPGALAEEALQSLRPASWCLLLASAQEAVTRGVHGLVLLTDGAPADLEPVLTYAQTNPSFDLTIVIARRRVLDEAAQSPPSPEDVLGLRPAERCANLRVAVVPASSPSPAEAVAVASAMVGVLA